MAVTIRGKTLPLPILQGGMGVGISLDGLAGAVAACGGMGTLSTAVCGFQEPDFAKRPFEANLRALDRQVRHAKVLAHGAGLIAVNAMVATTQYADSVRTALRAGLTPSSAVRDFPRSSPRWPPKFPTVTPPSPPSSAAAGRQGCCASCGTGTMAASPTF